MAKRVVPRSQTQWALIGREFRRRRLAVLAAIVVFFLISTCVLAPFLANDRPLYYEGYNRFEYREAARTLGVLTNKAATSATSEDSAETSDNPSTLRKSIGLQIRLMSRALEAERAAELREVGARIAAILSADAIDAAAATELKSMRVDLRKRFAARNVKFVSHGHWPVFATLDWLDIGLVVLIGSFVVFSSIRWLARNYFERHRRARSLLPVYVALLPVLAAAVAWFAITPRVDRTNYKSGVRDSDTQAIDRAAVVYQSVVWPIIPYGLDEDNLDAKYLKPTFFADEPNDKLNETPTPTRAWDTPHWLGTDGIGRDILCRMIWGGRVSLAVGLVAVSIYVTVGIVVGSIAGYFRGTCDLIISRLIEIVICFPSFFLILTIVAFIGPSIFNIMIVIGLTGWTSVARLVRGEFLRLGEQEFVLAGRALGYSPLRIIFRHVLPNAMAPVLVSATFGIAGAILTESALSFLGFGITVPKPSWGGILATGRDAIFRAPWMIYFPGLAIFLTITAYNLVGEALRDAADPRLRGQHP